MGMLAEDFGEPAASVVEYYSELTSIPFQFESAALRDAINGDFALRQAFEDSVAALRDINLFDPSGATYAVSYTDQGRIQISGLDETGDLFSILVRENADPCDVVFSSENLSPEHLNALERTDLRSPEPVPEGS